LVEWPDIIEQYYKADIIIEIQKTKNENERLINILN
jgi:tRNA A37 threonylcarbamoyladenosine biosynthesis protein TsaE